MPDGYAGLSGEIEREPGSIPAPFIRERIESRQSFQQARTDHSLHELRCSISTVEETSHTLRDTPPNHLNTISLSPLPSSDRPVILVLIVLNFSMVQPVLVSHTSYEVGRTDGY